MINARRIRSLRVSSGYVVYTIERAGPPLSVTNCVHRGSAAVQGVLADAAVTWASRSRVNMATRYNRRRQPEDESRKLKGGSRQLTPGQRIDDLPTPL